MATLLSVLMLGFSGKFQSHCNSALSISVVTTVTLQSNSAGLALVYMTSDLHAVCHTYWLHDFAPWAA